MVVVVVVSKVLVVGEPLLLLVVPVPLATGVQSKLGLKLASRLVLHIGPFTVILTGLRLILLLLLVVIVIVVRVTIVVVVLIC